jgi:short-subunit dehydrogenase
MGKRCQAIIKEDKDGTTLNDWPYRPPACMIGDIIQERTIMTKSALVTGASEGIGHSIAVKLAANGYTITAVARSEDKLATLVATLGTGHDYIVADLSDQTGQEKIVQVLSERHYNLLVNNAGVGTAGGFTEVPLERQLSMLSLNCEALVRLSYAFLTNAKPGDALVNVSSVLGFVPMPGLGLYSATKAFVTSFSETLWFEQVKRGIFVMALHPGITATNFQVNAGGSKDDIPASMAQTPEQVADTLIAALEAHSKPTIISGGKNKVFAGLSRILPRKSIVSMMGASMGKK